MNKFARILLATLLFTMFAIGGAAARGSQPAAKVGNGETFVVRPNFGTSSTRQIVQGVYSSPSMRNDAKSANLNSVNTNYAKVTLDGDRVKTLEIDALEIASPFYDGESMPHFVEFGLIYVVQVSGLIPNGVDGASNSTAHDHSYMIDGEGLKAEEQAEITRQLTQRLRR